MALTGDKRGGTAFVLAGGGSLGAVQVGMLAELAASGVRPDLIVGVSAGALNGAFLAHEPDTETVERMSGLWSRVKTREALGLSWRSVLGVLGLREFVADPRGLRGILERELACRTFEELHVPLHVVAAELATGEEVVISQGEVIPAVLASTAIPGVFPPVVMNGRTLVDGVVAAGTPIATAVRLGVSRIIIVPCGFTCAGKTVPRHALGRAMHAISLLGARQLRHDFERYSASATLRMVPPLCPLSQSAYDYSRGAELIARARASTRRWLDTGGLERGEFPHELVEHVH